MKYFNERRLYFALALSSALAMPAFASDSSHSKRYVVDADEQIMIEGIEEYPAFEAASIEYGFNANVGFTSDAFLSLVSLENAEIQSKVKGTQQFSTDVPGFTNYVLEALPSLIPSYGTSLPAIQKGDLEKLNLMVLEGPNVV